MRRAHCMWRAVVWVRVLTPTVLRAFRSEFRAESATSRTAQRNFVPPDSRALPGYFEKHEIGGRRASVSKPLRIHTNTTHNPGHTSTDTPPKYTPTAPHDASEAR